MGWGKKISSYIPENTVQYIVRDIVKYQGLVLFWILYLGDVLKRLQRHPQPKEEALYKGSGGLLSQPEL